MNSHQIIGIVLLVSIFFILFFLIKFMSVESKQFWNEIQILEEKIQNTNDISELEKLYEEDFKKLKRLSFLNPHHTKLGFIFGMLKGKIEGLKHKM